MRLQFPDFKSYTLKMESMFWNLSCLVTKKAPASYRLNILKSTIQIISVSIWRSRISVGVLWSLCCKTIPAWNRFLSKPLEARASLSSQSQELELLGTCDAKTTKFSVLNKPSCHIILNLELRHYEFGVSSVFFKTHTWINWIQSVKM